MDLVMSRGRQDASALGDTVLSSRVISLKGRSRATFYGDSHAVLLAHVQRVRRVGHFGEPVGAKARAVGLFAASPPDRGFLPRGRRVLGDERTLALRDPRYGRFRLGLCLWRVFHSDWSPLLHEGPLPLFRSAPVLSHTGVRLWRAGRNGRVRDERQEEQPMRARR